MTNTRSIEDLYQEVRKGTLPAGELGHYEHIRLAWYYLSQWPLPESAERFEKDLLCFVDAVGAHDKYHRTDTFALLQLIFSHMDEEDRRSQWAAFVDDASPLFEDALEVLGRYYSNAVLFSEAARLNWVEPDIQALPGVPIRPATDRQRVRS